MRAEPPPPRYRARARVEAIDEHPVSPFSIWLSVASDAWLPGDRATVIGELRALPGPQWAYDSDPQTIALRRGVFATVAATNPALAERLGPSADFAIARAQAAASARFMAQANGAGAATAAAMILGDRRFLSQRDEEAMARAGFVHVISVSGLHLSALGLLLWLVLRRGLRASPKIAVPIALSVVWVYALFSGAEAPALRSAIMQTLTLIALANDRVAAPKRTLALSLAALCLVWPESTRDPSFAFSFITMLALIVVTPRLRLPERRWLKAPVALVAAACIASIAAWPLSACWFGNIAIAGVITNLVAVPLATFVMLPLGVLWLLSFGALPLLAAWLALAGEGLVAIAHAVPMTLAPDVLLRDPEVILAYAALACVASAHPALRRPAIAFAAAFFVLFAQPAVARWTSSDLTLHTLPVGQGDGHVLFLPGGTTIVIDGGGTPDGRVDPGRRVLRPFLLAHRVRSLDAVVLTHAHPDHYGGLADVVTHFATDAFVWPGQGGESTGMRHLLALVRGARIDERLAADARLPTALLLLHPLPGGAEPYYGELSLNDNAIVLRAEHAGRSILLTGDVEAIGEDLLQTPPADVLKLAHHGSRTSTSAEFLARVRPSIAVVSAGRDNPFGHPHADVVARLAGAGVPLLRTDTSGAVEVRIGADGVLRATAFHEE